MLGLTLKILRTKLIKLAALAFITITILSAGASGRTGYGQGGNPLKGVLPLFSNVFHP